MLAGGQCLDRVAMTVLIHIPRLVGSEATLRNMMGPSGMLRLNVYKHTLGQTKQHGRGWCPGSREDTIEVSVQVGTTGS